MPDKTIIADKLQRMEEALPSFPSTSSGNRLLNGAEPIAGDY